MSNGEHEVTLATVYGDVTAVFNVTGSSDDKKEEEIIIPDDAEDETAVPTSGDNKSSTDNPKTVDNVVYYMLAMFLSWTAIMGIKLYKRN